MGFWAELGKLFAPGASTVAPAPQNAPAASYAAPLRYLIAVEDQIPGTDDALFEMGYDGKRPGKGRFIQYGNLYDQTGLDYGPYRPATSTAAQYGEKVVDPKGAGWSRLLNHQIDKAVAKGAVAIEWDNPDGYDQAAVLSAVALAAQRGLKVIAKNPLACNWATDPYVAHPDVIGIVVEKDDGAMPVAYDALRKKANKPELPIWFVAFKDKTDDGRAWATKTATEAGAFRNMWVSFSPDGEYTTSIDISAPPAPTVVAAPLDATAAVLKFASDSSLAHHEWTGRGRAPIGYVKGMALTYARVYAKLKAGDSAALEMAKANTGDDTKDAISWYNSNFRALGMDNSKAGANTLRHLWVLLIGLGIRESSGIYTEGRDMSASNTSADTAEAGLFQASWNFHASSAEIVKLFHLYSSDAAPDGYMAVFQEGISRPISSSFGGGEGYLFQRLAKMSPAFAAESAAVGLRNIGGKSPYGHWGPIRTKAAEIRPEADALLRQVERVVDGVVAPSLVDPPKPIPTPAPDVVVHNKWPAQSECDAFYGDPRGARGGSSSMWEHANLVQITPPWTCIDEDSKKVVPHFPMHRKVKDSVDRIFAKTWEMYGKSQAAIEKDHLHLFSGTFVFRNIRGGSHLSMHSYGIAIDIAAGLNALGAPYNPARGLPMKFVELWEAEGWVWGGRWRGRPDAMHFQAATIG